MLGKLALLAGAGAAYLLRTPEGRARVLQLLRGATRRSSSAGGTVPPLVDHRHTTTASAGLPDELTGAHLLPDATPVEIARAVSEEQPHH